MSNQTQQTTGGIGFLGLLTIVFITLKLTGYIHWSWFWVISPLLVPFGILLFLLVIYALLTLAAALLKRHEQRKRAKAARPKFISDLDKRR